MTKLSRVKKNKNIYEEIAETDNHEALVDASLKDFSNRTKLNDEEESTDYQANRVRQKRYEDQPFNKPKEEILSDKDLLAEFIDEVKEYNIQRGLRKVNDTQINILKNLKSIDEHSTLDDESQTNNTSYIEIDEKEQEGSLLTLDDKERDELTREFESIMGHQDEKKEETPIEMTLDDLRLDEDDFKSQSEEETDQNEDLMMETDEEDSQFYKMITEEIKLNETEDDEVQALELEKEFDEADQQLLELTQTLSLQLESYEEDLSEVHDKVGALDRVLTVFVFILVLILVSIVSVVVYWLLKERGLL